MRGFGRWAGRRRGRHRLVGVLLRILEHDGPLHPLLTDLGHANSSLLDASHLRCTANNEISVSHIDDECHQREGAAVQPMVATSSVRSNGKGANGAPRGWAAGPSEPLSSLPWCTPPQLTLHRTIRPPTHGGRALNVIWVMPVTSDRGEHCQW